MATLQKDGENSIPIIFLKNPSAGHTDPYTTSFAPNTPLLSSRYESLYVPVLEHTSDINPILHVLSQFNPSQNVDQDPTVEFPYGGLIFTSQRAVEAFALALECRQTNHDSKLNGTAPGQLQRLAVPLYVVGPATARSLEGVRIKYMPSCWVGGGEEAGTGELLAALILRNYNSYWNKPTGEESKTKRGEKKPLLFLTGEKHRDIVPSTLTSAPGSQRIDVETMVVYATSESLSFASDITNALTTASSAAVRWIVIFSPIGGESLLRALGWLSDSSSNKIIRHQDANRKTFIASIGPTTRDYMKRSFGFDVDACAETPSPEGVRKGIEEFMQTRFTPP
ncbi:MAG: hypothetical protein Q9209_000510 [Squamulea sp. 1 TL-2023]